ncbi:hypothetical protein B0T25DRAFT_418272, partial [Lasiosphaeria hispida]
FKHPALRRCRFDPETIKWCGLVGDGDEGCVFKVQFGDEGPFAVKIFWNSVPQPGGIGPYWPFQYECRNAAILDQMRSAVADVPVTIHRDPLTRDEALRNIWAFSTEGRAHRKTKEEKRKKQAEGSAGENDVSGSDKKITISSLPDIPICHGWLKFDAAKIPWPYTTYQRCRDPVDMAMQDRYAIVYDYVSSGKVDIEVAQAQFDFFYRTGFAMMPHRESNWRQGRLVDFGDLLPVLS